MTRSAELRVLIHHDRRNSRNVKALQWSGRWDSNPRHSAWEPRPANSGKCPCDKRLAPFTRVATCCRTSHGVASRRGSPLVDRPAGCRFRTRSPWRQTPKMMIVQLEQAAHVEPQHVGLPGGIEWRGAGSSAPGAVDCERGAGSADAPRGRGGLIVAFPRRAAPPLLPRGLRPPTYARLRRIHANGLPALREEGLWPGASSATVDLDG